MNAKKFQAAMDNLEELHWHLNRNGGCDMWTRELMQQFQDAYNANEDASNIDDELVEVTETGFGRIIEKPTNRQYPE